MTIKPVEILLVEDNMDHISLIKRSLKSRNIVNNIQVVYDGQAALDYLFRRGPYSDPATSPRPHLILLDVRLPKVDGFEVLGTIKKHGVLKDIPVIILTTSDKDEDIEQGYAMGANSYVTKPIDFEDFKKKIADLKIYWALVSELPGR